MSDLVSAAASGDRAGILAALRDLLAYELIDGESGGKAALAREFRETVRELSTISAPEVDEVDELRARRSNRRSAPTA